ncbi:hypothetical protein NXH76_06995 [Blautia schinkii]|nr:hypothetical protein [Blautia schinkii]
MFDKRWIREKKRRIRRKLQEQDADTRGFHSRGYHRHFEGYTEYKMQDITGRVKIVREYTGCHYRQKLNTLQYILLRGGYLVIYTLMIGLLVSAGWQKRAGDAVWYLVYVQLAVILSLMALGYTLLVNYVPAPRSMTVGDYKSAAKGLKTASVVVSICFLTAACLTIFYMILHRDVSGAADTGAAVKFILGGILAFLIYFVECKVPYEESTGNTEPKAGGIEIES